MREMKAKVENVYTRLKMNGKGWAVVACMFQVTLLLAECEEELGKWWMNFIMCKRKKLKVNAGKKLGDVLLKQGSRGG